MILLHPVGDYRHIISLTAGKTFKKNWEAGIRFRYNSGSPFTPFDIGSSSLRENWDISGQGILDNNRLNDSRTKDFHQLDVRIDKKILFQKLESECFPGYPKCVQSTHRISSVHQCTKRRQRCSHR
jgi:hypothetical protein